MITRTWLLCSAILSTCALARADFLSRLFPHDFQVVTNTDVIDPSVTPPSPDQPVAYIAVSAGYRDLGFPIAGEKIPKQAEVVKLVTKILGKQGYRLASTKAAPTLMIVYAWGTLYPDHPYSNAPYYIANRNQILAFLGAAKVGMETNRTATAFPELARGLTPLSSDASALMEMTKDGLYIISLSAYDFDAARKGTAKLLWRTNISTPSMGHYLPEVIPTMLTIAGPYIGRETVRPVRVDVGEKYRPNVEIGPARVVDEENKPETRR